MDIDVDKSTKFKVDLGKISDHLVSWYETNKHLSDTVTMMNGKRIDFSRKSITRLALKAALVPIAIPTLEMLYKIKGAELPPHEKHADLIDYVVIQLIKFIGLLDKDSLYVETIQGNQDNERLVYAISTAVPAAITSGRDTSGESGEAAEKRTGGEALLRSGQNGDGEDETYQGDST